MYVSIQNSSKDAEAKVWQSQNANDTAEQFMIVPTGNAGVYYIFNVNSGDVLDVPGGSKDAGKGIQQFTPNGTAAQQFQLTSV
eukprot:CAMPEP_0201581562 /NCGR_PEP_ID=MMETSP0190_2-20130828/71070_1 /ASSEMBLY_ACC=CAM_ASM_000263 /TAXON_ID=37353 /ORGANISM="Rosalina sp." /LENGTH=82 /DNA_ID=CAMNT_0048019797 /DNA_START=297 /DNA_END=545 /DNA_ORIENTATION=+